MFGNVNDEIQEYVFTSLLSRLNVSSNPLECNFEPGIDRLMAGFLQQPVDPWGHS
jgi:hypothetical protein